MYPKFVKKIQTMVAAELELKSPSVPLFSKGEFSPWVSPLFGKEGKGRFLGGNGGGDHSTNFGSRRLDTF